MNAELLIEPATLRSALMLQSEQARKNGALQPIETETSFVEQDGVCFLIRVARNLRRKAEQAAKLQRERQYDPFLPPEQELTVGAISETHLAVLNKFNVVDHHLLLVTRAFEDQENLLTVADFEALRRCLVAYDGLGFYNGGRVAGASQSHKHLQIIPLPLTRDGPPIPIDPLIQDAPFTQGVVTLPTLPFPHRFIRLDPDWPASQNASRAVHDLYLAMLSQFQQPQVIISGEARQSAPYNLLVTRRWMLLVPRTQEYFGTLSINAMAFAGSFFVKDREELEQVKTAGPMRILEAVSK